MFIYQFFAQLYLATLVELSDGGLCAWFEPRSRQLFFGSVSVASALGVLSSNDCDSVEFCGACDLRTTLKSGCEKQHSAVRLP